MVKKLWRDFTVRRVRTLLVVLSIAMGVLGITTVVGTLFTLEPRLLSAYLSANPADVTVTTNGVSAETLNKLKALPNVAIVEGAFIFHTRWQLNGEWETLKIITVPDLAAKQINRVTLESGHLPDSNSLLLERTVHDIADFAVGDSIVVQTPSGEQLITVAGIAYDPTTPSTQIYNIATGFMTLDSAEALLGSYDFNEVQIRVNDENTIAETAETVIATLQADGLPVLSSKSRLPGNYPGRSGFVAVLRLMALFSFFALGLCTFIVINTIVTILAAEVPQIGTMKAVGATRWMVMRSYLLLIFTYGLFGSLLGIGGGIVAINWLTRYIARIANVKVTTLAIPPLPVLISVTAVGILIPLLAALWPVYHAANVTAHEAMLSYGIRTKTTLLDRLLTRITFLPPTIALALRNTLHNKGRATLTIVALTIAGISFTSVHTTSASLKQTIEILTNTMDADVFTLLTVPAERSTILSLVGADNIDAHIETWLRQSFEIGDQVALLHGIPKASTIYDYQSVLVAGRWFKPDDGAVAIITEKFANENYYALGDRITLGKGEASQRWHIVGIVRDYTNQGRLFLVPYSELTALTNLPDQTNMVLTQLPDRSARATNLYLANLTERALRTGLEADIVSIDELRADGASQFQIIISFLSGMVALLTVVGALGLVSTLTINVTERLKEIGVMRSIGAGNTTITHIFWLEGVCLGTISWLLAALFSKSVARIFVNLLSSTLLPVEFTMPLTTLLLLAVGLLSVVSIAGFLPAWGASRINTSDILRYG